MERIMTAEETIRAFCHAWFEQRDMEGALFFLTEDITFIGTGENESANGRKEMADYLRQDIGEFSEPFTSELKTIHEQKIAEGVRNFAIEMMLKNEQYRWYLRGFFTLVQDGQKAWKICSLHFAEPGSSQRG